MKLNFNVTEEDLVAASERYLLDSPTHQQGRKNLCVVMPGIVAVVSIGFLLVNGMSTTPIVMLAGSLFVALCGPAFLDGRMRANVRAYAKEYSASSCGAYELQLLEEHLVSTSPLGSGTYPWSSVTRVVMDASHLFLFLGGMVFPLRIAEVGIEEAQKARDFVASRLVANVSPAKNSTAD